ncbi:MAG TPA: hypothetical protein VMF65_12270 [Acidimicrobiales bacterium]|nr:hypothetical protein [Acidimicrobiales bacterium]
MIGSGAQEATAQEVPNGYWVVRSDGTVSGYGVPSLGDLSKAQLSTSIVAAAATPGGGGYWLAAAGGGIFAFGNAQFDGSPGGGHLNKPIVGMAATPDGHGYWLVASDGGIFAYGDARFYGSTGSDHLNEPIVALAPTPDGHGYWLVASDGGIFAYGDAVFYGSAGGDHLTGPIVAMAATPDGHGYWLAASNGQIFAYGDATSYGSPSSASLVSPVATMAATPDGKGYWLGEQNGTISHFGDAPNLSQAGAGTSSSANVVAIIVSLITTPGLSVTTTSAAGTSSTTSSSTTTTTVPRTTTTVRQTTTTVRRTTTTVRRTTTTVSRTTTTVRRTTTTVPSTTTTVRRTTTTVPTTTTTLPLRSIGGGDPYGAQTFGFDVSWPQCSPRGSVKVQALPSKHTYAVVGVNNGGIAGFNPCFAAEARWAGANLSAYIILQAAPGGDPPQEAKGPKASCARKSNTCEGYDWGYNYAKSDIAFVRASGFKPKMWWLDIEIGENWPTSAADQRVNAAIIQGALDAIRGGGHSVGIYSTWYQWGEITGSYVPTSKTPLWVPGAYNPTGGVYSAASFCLRALQPGDPSKLVSSTLGFAGGMPWLVQYGYGGAPPPYGIDPDYACGQPVSPLQG